jgi:hypothetical protein
MGTQPDPSTTCTATPTSPATSPLPSTPLPAPRLDPNLTAIECYLHVSLITLFFILHLQTDGKDQAAASPASLPRPLLDLPSSLLPATIHLFEKASLEWCRGNSKIWENPVRENATHYTVGYTCKVVLRSYLALGCEVT